MSCLGLAIAKEDIHLGYFNVLPRTSYCKRRHTFGILLLSCLGLAMAKEDIHLEYFYCVAWD